MPRKLPKHHAGQIRKTVSLSFSAPVELEDYMNRAAARRQMNRSQFLCWLVTQYLYLERGQLPPAPFLEESPPTLPQVPSRIGKRRQTS
jgi:hypothetical protein